MTNQRHKYDYVVQSDSAPARVIGMVGQGRRVLELGPGPGSITKHLRDNGCRVTALEIDPQAIELVAAFCERVIPCNLNDANWPNLLVDAEKFSVIVAADVFEHLYDPWRALKQTLPLLAADGCLVVSLPHVGHNAVAACLINSDFAYQPWGLLDKTHIRFWGLINMQKLFVDSGYKIIEAEFVVREPEQTEFAYQWHKLSVASRAVLAGNRFGNVYQVVIRAVPQAAVGLALQLESLPLPAPAATAPRDDPSAFRGLLRRLGSKLDPATQVRVVKRLRSFGLWPKSGSSR